MQVNKKRGVSGKTTPINTNTISFYSNCRTLSIGIDELLAGLLFATQIPIFALSERKIALNAIEEIIRFKVDIGVGRRNQYV